MANSTFLSPGGVTNNGSTITMPLPLAVTGNITATGGDLIGTNCYLGGGARAVLSSPADGQVNFLNNALTTGVGLDVATDAVLKVRTRAQTGYATEDVLAHRTSGTAGVGFAMTTARPADQTGNATGTLKMNGLGAAAAPATITPTATGRVVFLLSGNVTNSTILDGVQLILVYGTGAAPANAAAATGTIISATQAPAAPVAAQNQGFSLMGSVTGLALTVAVWFDLQISNLTGGTASVSNITCVAFEI